MLWRLDEYVSGQAESGVFTRSADRLTGALPAAIIGLGMNYAAYEAEIYRAGLTVSNGVATNIAASRRRSTPAR